MKLKIEPGNVITFSVGLLFLAGALYVYTSLGEFIENARETSATVVEIVNEGGKKARMHPVLRFTTGDGREVKTTLQQHHIVQPGQTVRIVYDAVRPEQIEIGTLERTQNRRLLMSVLAAVIGVVVCTLGIALDANTLRWRL